MLCKSQNVKAQFVQPTILRLYYLCLVIHTQSFYATAVTTMPDMACQSSCQSVTMQKESTFVGGNGSNLTQAASVSPPEMALVMEKPSECYNVEGDQTQTVSVPPPKVSMIEEKASECDNVIGNLTQVASVPPPEMTLIMENRRSATVSVPGHRL